MREATGAPTPTHPVPIHVPLSDDIPRTAKSSRTTSGARLYDAHSVGHSPTALRKTWIRVSLAACAISSDHATHSRLGPVEACEKLDEMSVASARAATSPRARASPPSANSHPRPRAEPPPFHDA